MIQSLVAESPEVSGVFDFTGESVQVADSLFFLEKNGRSRYFVKAIDLRFRRNGSSGMPVFQLLRDHVLEGCECGVHALLHSCNEDGFNSHPQKHALDRSVTKPFFMALQTEDRFI